MKFTFLDEWSISVFFLGGGVGWVVVTAGESPSPTVDKYYTRHYLTIG